MAQQAVLLQTGRKDGSGLLHLYRKQGEQSCLLFLFEHRGSVRVHGRSYAVTPYTFLLLPFEEMQLHVQHSMPLQWAHLLIPADTLQAEGMRFGEVCSLAQPLTIMEIWRVLLSSAGRTSQLELQTQSHAAGLLFCLLKRDAAVSAEKAMQIPHYNKLAALRRDIYLNPAQDWNIQDICEDLSLSRPYFHKIYMSAFGISCTQDVIESRIACSKELLEQTDDAISEISQKCGFESDVYFMRQFKQRTGMTPTAYRRLCRQDAATV